MTLNPHRGTLTPSYPAFKTGKMSRSLVATFQLLDAGVAPKNTVHLRVRHAPLINRPTQFNICANCLVAL